MACWTDGARADPPRHPAHAPRLERLCAANHYSKYYYPDEVSDAQDIPWIAGFYVEHKNVMGMTVRFTVDNVFNGRHTLDRVVYTGYRDRSPVSFFDKRDQLVGPLFNLSVKGTF